MQLYLPSKENGPHRLGLIPEGWCALRCRTYKVPQMGWNRLLLTDHPLWGGWEAPYVYLYTPITPARYGGPSQNPATGTRFRQHTAAM